jgi:quercetin dioxygenase-like cupin family protein
MIRRTFPLLIAVVVLFGLIAPRSLQQAVAQESTPMAGPELPPGVTAEFLGGAPLAELPTNPGLVVLVRLTLEPGAILPPEPNDPTGAFVVIESGALTTRATGPLTVSRASEEDFIMEPVAAETETTLGPGDALYVGPFQDTEVRNDGDEPAVFLLVNILPSEGGEEALPATPAA